VQVLALYDIHGNVDALEAVLADPALQRSCSLEPGDVLFVDNRRVLHGRTAIAPGADRHLRRLKIFAS
jgi:alpha-ketoglutarate-dependent taurine dioxygenase